MVNRFGAVLRFFYHNGEKNEKGPSTNTEHITGHRRLLFSPFFRTFFLFG
jgi:hypothetical protein